MRRHRNHRPLHQPPPTRKWTSQTRDALTAILEADTSTILSEEMYSDGLGLERLVEAVGGKRSAALEVICELVRKATAEGMPAGGINMWSYFVRPAKMEMARLQAA
jgi:hypothetical protein